MDIGDTLDARNEDFGKENLLMNDHNDVNPYSEYGVSKSRKLLRQKNAHLLSSGKWLQIVKNSPRVSCEVTTSPSHFLSKLGVNYAAERDQSQKMLISLPSKNVLSPSTDISQGTLQFTMGANQKAHFVFKVENQKDVYTASLSSNVQEQKVVDDSYMIHLQRGESSLAHLVGRIKVSTLLNETTIEREFVLFSSSDGEHPQIPCRKKNRGLSKKVVDVIKKNTQNVSRLSRNDLCNWNEPFQEQKFDHKQVSLLENNLPTNLETLAVVVKQELLEETGGWGLKFLKKSPLVKTETETSRSLLSMDVVIPSGIHGGPEDGPLSLIERWKSQGSCDCEGWDLGCSLALLRGQSQKDQCNPFELSTEGSKHETSRLSIENVNVGGGHYIVQFQREMSVMQTFSIALAFVHSQNQKLDP